MTSRPSDLEIARPVILDSLEMKVDQAIETDAEWDATSDYVLEREIAGEIRSLSSTAVAVIYDHVTSGLHEIGLLSESKATV